MKIAAIMIEAGHGKKRRIPFTDFGAAIDPGAVMRRKFQYDILTEREVNQKVAALLHNKLLKVRDELHGADIVQIGINTEGTVQGKTNYGNMFMEQNGKNPAECFSFSIHCNPDYGDAVSGVEGYYQTKRPYNENMLKFILGGLKDQQGQFVWSGIRKYFKDKIFRKTMPSKDSRFGRLYIDDYKCNAFLIELGFLGNKQDVVDMYENANRMAEAIANGIMEWFRQSGIEK